MIVVKSKYSQHDYFLCLKLIIIICFKGLLPFLDYIGARSGPSRKHEMKLREDLTGAPNNSAKVLKTYFA